MTVVRYEPWALVSRLQKDIDRLFGAPLTTAADSGAWLPPVDIHEEANQFALHVDLPGVDPKAVEITADQGVLTIRGQREDARRESREGYRRIERITGEFQRRFSCRIRPTPRTSRRSSSTACWKSQFRNWRRCSRTGLRWKLRNRARRAQSCV